MADIDWAKALDLPRAVRNVRSEFVGDWYRDPWGWPELGFMLKKDTGAIFANLNASGARRAALIDVPKENWGSRPAVVLDILDRLTYQALVDRLSLYLIGTLSPNVFGWRLRPGTDVAGDYSHNNVQWEAYRNHLGLNATFFEVALTTDVVSFFAAVRLDNLADIIDDKAPKGAVSQRLIDFLEGFDKVPERSGLPQRSLASAVLANAVLAPIDDVLEHYAKDVPVLYRRKARKTSRPIRTFARWMDDMWLFGDDAARLRRAQTELQDVARSIGLNLNSAKTEVLEGDDVGEKALQIEHSAIENALDMEGDEAPLEQLIDELLDKPDTASRTSLKFVATRMRKHQCDYRIQEFATLAKRMPHAADALAPLFKQMFTSASLQEWFLDYARSDWAAFQWSVAQYARMFPSGPVPRKATREFYSEIVADSDSALPLLAVAAQRLASWDPSEARAVIRAAMAKTNHPQPRRVLALAALSGGETRAMVRRWLRQEEENSVTLRMLENSNFEPPKVVGDFAR